jgi:hypothetical protein
MNNGMDAGKRLALIRIVGPDFVAGFRIWLPSGSRNKIVVRLPDNPSA